MLCPMGANGAKLTITCSTNDMRVVVCSSDSHEVAVNLRAKFVQNHVMFTVRSHHCGTYKNSRQSKKRYRSPTDEGKSVRNGVWL